MEYRIVLLVIIAAKLVLELLIIYVLLVKLQFIELVMQEGDVNVKMDFLMLGLKYANFVIIHA